MSRNNKDQRRNNNNGNNKQAAKEAAKQAAASGSYSKQNTQAMRQAGVSKSSIQQIRGTGRSVKQTNKNAELARDNPIYQGAGFQDAVQNQASKGTVGQAFFDSPEFAAVRGDLTNQQVAEYAMSQGYGLGDQWQKDFGTSPAQTLKQALNGDAKMRLGQLLKIASGQGNGTDLVDKREFNKIHGYFDGKKSGLKITGRMDKINAKQQGKENGFNPMGLQSDVFGRINKGKYGDHIYTYDPDRRNNAGLLYGNGAAVWRHKGPIDGPLSKLAINYQNNNLKDVKGFGVYGADANGNAIFSPGQGGRSWSDNKINKPTSYSPWATNTQPVSPLNPEGGAGGGTPGLPAETPGFGSGGIGDTGEKNALTFRQAKSRWKQSGQAYKGTSGLKYSRSAGFGGFGAGAASY